MFCSNCGKEISNNSKFCNYCGKSININELSTNTEYLKKEQKNKKGRITDIGPGIIFIVIIIIFVSIITNLNNITDTSSTLNNNTENNISSNSNSKNSFISLEEFNKIKSGMTYEDVVNIIGSNGTLSSESNIANYNTQIYTWYGNILGANANVTFQNGKVVGKAQVGLSN